MPATVCGWCAAVTTIDRCSACGRDPGLPYAQRATAPPVVRGDAAGRPPLEAAELHRRLATAEAELARGGRKATVDALAVHLDVSPKTVRRWRQMVAGR